MVSDPEDDANMEPESREDTGGKTKPLKPQKQPRKSLPKTLNRVMIFDKEN